MTEPERRLWDAYPTGAMVELGPDLPAEPAPGRTVRAEVVCRLLLGAVERRPGHVPAIRLRGAYLTGRIDVMGGTVDCEFRLEFCHLAEAPMFANAQTRHLRFAACRMPGFDGGGLRADGYLSMSGSVIDGEVRLPRAQISDGLRMNDTRITETDPQKWGLFSGALQVDAGAFFRDAEITGGVRLVGARMNGGLFMVGATLRNPGRMALDGQNLVVDDACELSRGFTAEGTVRLRGARVNGTLSFDQAIVRAPGRRLALQLSHMQVDELILALAEPPREPVSLAHSRLGVLLDPPESWAAELYLNGLVYESLRAAPPPRWLEWVARDIDGFHPQPYEQLATWYRGTGHEDLARRAQLAKLRARRPMLRPPGRVWSRLLDLTVGYGYRPWRAFMWFALLLAAGTTVFSAERPRPLKPPAERPHYNAFIYTLDHLIPIPTFGQRELWDPLGWTQWLAYALIAAGWVLATALIAGMTRVLRPN
ncbi:hypothetical protein DPM19_18280 [Actinomadura craniellae]|uniref:Oxidoreductase n=1 Tax=Actinomadura craniellae TaxID=2231787 RepID=A0A365H3Z3_9ACTN|nr:hypothetical protein DPM19_18280 [Actinomadura craniellae]